MVIVKSADDVAGMIAGNALSTVATDASRLLVVMAEDGKVIAALKKLAARDFGDERLHVGKHAAYLWCANGILESKAADELFARLKDVGTTRNWATLNKIHELLRLPQ